MGEVSEWVKSALHFTSNDSYLDVDTSKGVISKMTYIEDKIYKLVILPLNEFQEDLDVVIIFGNPFQMMRLSRFTNIDMVNLNATSPLDSKGCVTI